MTALHLPSTVPMSVPARLRHPLVAPQTGAIRRLLALCALLVAGWLPTQAALAATVNLATLTSSHSYTPSLGEDLGRIVAKTLPTSPLSAELLGQAFVRLNPQAFSSGARQRTLGTVALKVPNHNQLLQMVLAQHDSDRPAAVTLAPAPSALSKAALAAAPRAVEKRENWVRYAGTSITAALNFDGSADYRKNWVHYLGTAVQRVLGGSAQRGESQRWVQYPRLVSAADAAAPAASDLAVAATEPSVDTRNWVRYTAGRSYPTQQFAQLFD
jgi:Tfp pilus assembly protein FimV